MQQNVASQIKELAMARKKTQTRQPENFNHDAAKSKADLEMEKLWEEINQKKATAKKAQEEAEQLQVRADAARAARALAEATPSPDDLTLPVQKRIEIALTEKSLETKQLAKVIKETIDATADAVRTLRGEGKIVNVNFEEHPIWRWRVGPGASTETVRKIIKELISERPMWLTDLERVTGIRQGDVSNHMTEIQKKEYVVDMSGGGHSKLYFLMPPMAAESQVPKVFLDTGKMKDARLKTKGVYAHDKKKKESED